MAERVVTLVIKTDDITGETIPDGSGETFHYAWDGTEYKIDLSDGNAKDIREMMSRLTSASQKVGRYKPGVSQPSRKSLPANADRPKELPSGELTPTQQKAARSAFLREIRQWAQDNGFPQQGMVGRLVGGVREAWDAAHPDRPAPTEDSFVK